MVCMNKRLMIGANIVMLAANVIHFVVYVMTTDIIDMQYIVIAGIGIVLSAFSFSFSQNLIITPNGENISPEEIENKIGENRLVQEVLVRKTEFEKNTTKKIKRF